MANKRGGLRENFPRLSDFTAPANKKHVAGTGIHKMCCENAQVQYALVAFLLLFCVNAIGGTANTKVYWAGNWKAYFDQAVSLFYFLFFA